MTDRAIRRVVVFDDSPSQRAWIETLLRREGCAVHACASAAAAVDEVVAFAPDLVLMDVVMPGVSGFEATRLLRAHPATCRIPVVFLTSKGEEVDRAWGRRQGGVDHWVKPVRDETVREALRHPPSAWFARD